MLCAHKVEGNVKESDGFWLLIMALKKIIERFMQKKLKDFESELNFPQSQIIVY